MLNLLGREITYFIIRVIGFTFLAAFLLLSSDFSFSVLGTLGYIVISYAVSYLVAGLKFAEHFPALNKYHFASTTKSTNPESLSDQEWALKQARYLKTGIDAKRIFLSPSEDGLICVPIILIGVNSVSALLGGVAFGLLHIGRFTYLECIAKAIAYGLICYFILPLGLLTVVVGHLVTNSLSLVLLRVIIWKLSKQELSRGADSRRSV